ncbi:MAG: alpha/beta fold hydrolase [Roseburia sp.]|nr:alpha/beta fold hydrolase [Roseburia sp.]
MKKNTKRFLLLTTAAVGSIYAFNRFIAETSASKKLLTDGNGSYYNWKFGKVFYTKKGNGTPLLLIHDTDVSSSSFEWYKLVKKLEKNHTVYTIDLIGCGRSDKPALTYTNYLYVQLIGSFVHDVIGTSTDVIASQYSSTFTLMANQLDPELFDHIILINPPSIKGIQGTITTANKVMKDIMELPLIGTFVYNLTHRRSDIDSAFRQRYFKKPQLILGKLEDIYYEAAHSNNGNGKYLYASQISNYMNVHMDHVIRKLEKPVHMIASQDLKSNISAMDSYRHLNSSIEIHYLSGCKLLPQLEIPEKLLATVNAILDK